MPRYPALAAGAGFRECFDSFDGMGHGTAEIGWSAALSIDLIRSTGLGPAG